MEKLYDEVEALVDAICRPSGDPTKDPEWDDEVDFVYEKMIVEAKIPGRFSWENLGDF